jgi:hypothetical protein
MDGRPAFLSRPEGSPVYYGFPLIEETRTDGWCYGAITEFEDPEGCDFGDGYVQAPNGERAGLVWQVGTGLTREVVAPEEDRWGVYEVWFPRAVRDVKDITSNFRYVLPELKVIYGRIQVESR